MSIYRIMITGKHVNLKTENGAGRYGFVKNEYICARDEHTAIRRAKEKILYRIKKRGITQPSNLTLDLTVDEIEAGVSAWKLISNESFIFFEDN